MDRYFWAEAPPYPRERDPRADDPDYYYERGQGWIKRTEWTVDNEPSCSDWKLYGRFLKETTRELRTAIVRERAEYLAPDATGILRDKKLFFREGRSGAATEVIDEDYLSRYRDRARALAPPDLLAWLHNDG